MIATTLLIVACALLFYAIMRRDEKTLLTAIVSYAAATFYIVMTMPELFVPAIVLAITLASLGLFRFLLNGRPWLLNGRPWADADPHGGDLR